MKKVRNAFIGIFAVVMIMLCAAYGFGFWFFQTHFLPGTVINNFDCSYITLEESIGLLNRSVKAYALAVNIRNNGVEKISADDAGMEFIGGADLAALMKSQSCIKWFIPQNRSLYLRDAFSIDIGKLHSSIDDLTCMKDMQAPVNAHLVETKKGFQVIDATMGTTLDKDKVYDTIENAVRRGLKEVSLEDCYLNPEVTSTDSLLEKTDLLKTYKNVIITYDFGDRKETVDYSTVESFLTDFILDENKVREYVQGLADKYDTIGISRVFVTYDNRKIDLTGGTYGWAIDVDEETKNLINNINLGLIDVVEPAYKQKGESRDKNDIGYTYLEIDQTFGKFVYYVDGTPIVETEGEVQGHFRPGVYTPTVTDGKIVFGDIYQISADLSAIEDYSSQNGVSVSDMVNSPANLRIGQEFLTNTVSQLKPNIAVVVY